MLKYKFIIAIILAFSIIFISCSELRKAGYVDKIPKRQKYALSGNEFIEKARKLDAEQREKLILEEICSGNFPNFMRKLVTIKTMAIIDGKFTEAKYFVMSDYLMTGSDDDFIRLPMQPKTAQKIADEFGFFLSTPKICDDIYNNAKIKLEPHPLSTARDNFDTFVQHNKIIENQRRQRKGLIAGIKKDVVITGAMSKNPKTGRVVIYGWHNLDGKPVQPVYSGHVDWYVDYSHGIRLVYQTILINGKPMNYCDVLNDDKLSILLCNEDDCTCFKYHVE
ncbi:MAG: hypothetical protein LBF04_04845 [Prevotellaceae bacterium]|jgi:hypothetical protein|nr:hypothetical protein [Prevotellaceae bacterium]